MLSVTVIDRLYHYVSLPKGIIMKLFSTMLLLSMFGLSASAIITNHETTLDNIIKNPKKITLHNLRLLLEKEKAGTLSMAEAQALYAYRKPVFNKQKQIRKYNVLIALQWLKNDFLGTKLGDRKVLEIHEIKDNLPFAIDLLKNNKEEGYGYEILDTIELFQGPRRLIQASNETQVTEMFSGEFIALHNIHQNEMFNAWVNSELARREIDKNTASGPLVLSSPNNNDHDFNDWIMVD